MRNPKPICLESTRIDAETGQGPLDSSPLGRVSKPHISFSIIGFSWPEHLMSSVQSGFKIRGFKPYQLGWGAGFVRIPVLRSHILGAPVQGHRNQTRPYVGAKSRWIEGVCPTVGPTSPDLERDAGPCGTIPKMIEGDLALHARSLFPIGALVRPFRTQFTTHLTISGDAKRKISGANLSRMDYHSLTVLASAGLRTQCRRGLGARGPSRLRARFMESPR